MFWMLKRTVSLRRFFWVPTTYVLVGKFSFLIRTLNSSPVGTFAYCYTVKVPNSHLHPYQVWRFVGPDLFSNCLQLFSFGNSSFRDSGIFVIIFFIIIFLEYIQYGKTCVKRPLPKRPKIGFQDQLSLNVGQKHCRMLQGEHSAILLIFIKLHLS